MRARASATEQVVVEEFLDGEELSLLALCDGERAIADGARAGLQAHLRRRRGAEHRRHGLLLAGARLRRARARGAVRAVHQPVVDELRRRGTPFHGILYAGLMLTADGRARARVQRALRRPRDAGGAAAAALATCSTCSRARREPGGLGGRRAGVGRAHGGHARARERAATRSRPAPATSIAGLDAVAGRTSRSRTPAPARRGRRDRHGRRPRAERDGARRRPGRRPRRAPMLPPTRSTSKDDRCAATSRCGPWSDSRGGR